MRKLEFEPRLLALDAVFCVLFCFFHIYCCSHKLNQLNILLRIQQLFNKDMLAERLSTKGLLQKVAYKQPETLKFQPYFKMFNLFKLKKKKQNSLPVSCTLSPLRLATTNLLVPMCIYEPSFLGVGGVVCSFVFLLL